MASVSGDRARALSRSWRHPLFCGYGVRDRDNVCNRCRPGDRFFSLPIGVWRGRGLTANAPLPQATHEWREPHETARQEEGHDHEQAAEHVEPGRWKGRREPALAAVE